VRMCALAFVARAPPTRRWNERRTHMTLDIQTLTIPGPLLISVGRFGDARGYFSETYNARAFAEAGIGLSFVQDNHSYSAMRGTVRGLHFQRPPKAQGKLVRVLRGRILDVFVDIRKGSAQYGAHGTAELAAKNGEQLFVPQGFAHGFCTLEPDTDVLYKTSDYYAPETEGGILWNDPALSIPWPDFAGSVVSPKDTELPVLAKLDSPFGFTP
jgi:dTDP-4-dehydrorhamnose 3,5-epimerase